MADYIYNSEGQAQGFRVGGNIYDMDGVAVGRVWAERAYRFDGTYVGLLFKNMVVDKPTVSTRNLPPMAPPPNIGRAPIPEDRRPLNHEYSDVFHLLIRPPEGAGETASSSMSILDDPDDDFF